MFNVQEAILQIKNNVEFDIHKIEPHTPEEHQVIIQAIADNFKTYGDKSVFNKVRDMSRRGFHTNKLSQTIFKFNHIIFHAIHPLANIGLAGLKAIAEIININNPNLTFLALDECTLGDEGAEGAKYIAAVMQANGVITLLRFNDNYIGNKGAEYMAQMLIKNCTLLDIDLSWNNISDEGIAYLAESLKHNKTLLGMYLKSNKIDKEGIQKLAAALKVNTTLVNLELQGNSADIPSEILYYLVRNRIMAGLENEQEIVFDRLNGNDPFIKMMILAKIKNNPYVTSVKFSNVDIGDEHIGAIAEAINNNTNITSLSFVDGFFFSDNIFGEHLIKDNNRTPGITGKGLEILVNSIKYNKSITAFTFDVHPLKLTKEECNSIIEALKINTTLNQVTIVKSVEQGFLLKIEDLTIRNKILVMEFKDKTSIKITAQYLGFEACKALVKKIKNSHNNKLENIELDDDCIISPQGMLYLLNCYRSNFITTTFKTSLQITPQCYYIKHEINDDGNRWYALLGITREQAVDLLKNHAKDLLKDMDLLTYDKFIEDLINDGIVSKNTTQELQSEDSTPINYVNILQILHLFAALLGIELRIWQRGNNGKLYPLEIIDQNDYSIYKSKNKINQRRDIFFTMPSKTDQKGGYDLSELSKYGEKCVYSPCSLVDLQNTIAKLSSDNQQALFSAMTLTQSILSPHQPTKWSNLHLLCTEPITVKWKNGEKTDVTRYFEPIITNICQYLYGLEDGIEVTNNVPSPSTWKITKIYEVVSKALREVESKKNNNPLKNKRKSDDDNIKLSNTSLSLVLVNNNNVDTDVTTPAKKMKLTPPS